MLLSSLALPNSETLDLFYINWSIWCQYDFIIKELILIFTKVALKLSKVRVKMFIKLQKISTSNKCQ